MSALLSLLWSQFGTAIMTGGAALAAAIGLYLKGRSDQKSKAKIEDLQHAIDVSDKADIARDAANRLSPGMSDDGFKRD